MKKYQVIFNSDYKSISFYKDNNKYNDRNTFIDSKKEEIIFYIIIYIFVGSLFILFGIFLRKNFCNIKRKIYAKELEDCNYVSESKENEINNNKEKLLLEI